MNFITLAYNEAEKEYSYLISPNAPPNCKILDFKKYSELKIQDDFILFIGCIWYGIDISISNSLSEIACNYPNINFYFKLIFAEEELESLIPEEIPLQKLPVILKISDFKTTVVSNGLISRDELDNKILKLLSNTNNYL